MQDLKSYPDEKTGKYLEGGAQPCRMSVLTDSEWQKKYPLLTGLSENLPLSEYKWMMIPEFSEIAVVMADEIQAAFVGDKEPETALNDMADGITGVFKKSGRV